MNTDVVSVEGFAKWATDQLSDTDLYYGHGSQDAQDEAHWLASYIANFSYSEFDTSWQKPLSLEQIEQGKTLLASRISSKKPLAYLINQIWFAGFRFYIDEGALVPRSHLGEWVPECFEPWIDSIKVNDILDLCCGGGSIGVASALTFDQACVDLADLSESALQVSQKNIDYYELSGRVNTIHSDLFENITKRYDLILCNPPYVSLENMKKLPTEFLFEPEMALVSGEKGLDCISIILSQAHRFLTDSGALILEAGTSAPALEEALNQVPLNWMLSASGESVVLMITKDELIMYKEKIQSLIR